VANDEWRVSHYEKSVLGRTAVRPLRKAMRPCRDNSALATTAVRLLRKAMCPYRNNSYVFIDIGEVEVSNAYALPTSVEGST
jgi:hypothetical protein